MQDSDFSLRRGEIVTIYKFMPPTFNVVQHDRPIVGALFIVSAELVFVLMGASIRQVSDELNNGIVVFARNIVGLALLSSVTTLLPGNPGWRTRVPHLHLLRGLSGLGARYCFYYAIAHMPHWRTPCCSS